MSCYALLDAHLLVLIDPTLKSPEHHQSHSLKYWECLQCSAQPGEESLKEPLVPCRYNFTQTNCIHGTGCKNRKEGRECRIGMRLQRTQLITGESAHAALGVNV